MSVRETRRGNTVPPHTVGLHVRAQEPTDHIDCPFLDFISCIIQDATDNNNEEEAEVTRRPKDATCKGGK